MAFWKSVVKGVLRRLTGTDNELKTNKLCLEERENTGKEEKSEWEKKEKSLFSILTKEKKLWSASVRSLYIDPN